MARDTRRRGSNLASESFLGRTVDYLFGRGGRGHAGGRVRIVALADQLRVGSAEFVQRDPRSIRNGFKLVQPQIIPGRRARLLRRISRIRIYPRSATWLFMNASPSWASCSSFSYMRRQIFVAATSSGNASPNASIISQPS